MLSEIDPHNSKILIWGKTVHVSLFFCYNKTGCNSVN